MKKVLRTALLLIAIFYLILVPFSSLAETLTGTTKITVRATLLNGRAAPRKKASVEARFDFGDILDATGDWSPDHKWIEVAGGETGTVWVSIRYISERPHYKAKNVRYKSVKVRKWPEVGRVTTYIKKGQIVEITQEVLGWGKTKHGWVDLYYLEEVEEE